MTSFGFRLICCLYLVFNIIFYVYYAAGNPLSGDFKENFGSLELGSLTLGLVAVFVSLIILLFLCKIILKLPMRAYIKVKSNPIVDVTLFIIAVFYFMCVTIFGVGLSGVDESNLTVSKVVLYSYALLQPNFLIMIYLFCFYHVRNFLFTLTLLFYVVTSILSGATVNLIFIFLLWATYTAYKKRVIFLLLAGILFSPFIRFIKYVLLTYNRSLSSQDGREITQAIATYKTDSMSWLDTYLFFFKGAFSRFEMVSSNSFIIDNHSTLSSFANSLGFIYPRNLYFTYKFTLENYFLYSDKSQYSLQYIFAYFLSGATDWNANIGFFGFAIIGGLSSIVTYILVAVLLLVTIILSRVLQGDGAIKQLTLIYVVIVLWHGWVIAYIYYAHALTLFTVVILVSGRFKSYKIKPRFKV